MARSLLIAALLACTPAWAQTSPIAGTWLVERLHRSGLVRLVPLPGGPALLLRTTQLPEGAREGDVLVEGRLDPALREALLRAQRAVRARALHGSFSIANGGGDTRPLTAGGER